MSEELKITHSELSDHSKGTLTPEEQIDFLQLKLEQAELRATEKGIALIEMTASRNALYQSLQETQMHLAETIGQHENDIEAYKKELEARLQEKRQIQEECDALAIKARRYDELQESVVKIKMNAELRAHSLEALLPQQKGLLNSYVHLKPTGRQRNRKKLRKGEG